MGIPPLGQFGRQGRERRGPVQEEPWVIPCRHCRNLREGYLIGHR